MAQKLHKINNTTYEAILPRSRIEVGDIDSPVLKPTCKMYNFDNETSLKVSYADRQYSLLSADLNEIDQIVMTEGEQYPLYEVGKLYNIGDLLMFEEQYYEVVQTHISQLDWRPSDVPALYKISTPSGIIAQWIQPLGSFDAYSKDTKVFHNNKIWKSDLDANVWEPSIYGWTETDGQVDVAVYCLDLEQNGGFEFEIIFRKKPNSNIINFNIETQGLEFYYQSELTQEEIDRGTYRPENVIGSYAVYHSAINGSYKTIEEANKYKTGKAFHIYRPKIIDSLGNWIWGSLNIVNSILSITIDQNWLDTAIYPIIVDPTFGFTEIGASNTAANVPLGNMFLMSGIGQITQISCYYSNTNSLNGQFALYGTSSNLAFNTFRASSNEFSIANGWNTQDLSFSFVGGNTLFLAQWAESSSTAFVSMDNTGNSKFWLGQTYNTWPANMDSARSWGTTFSLYATYSSPNCLIQSSISNATSQMINSNIIIPINLIVNSPILLSNATKISATISAATSKIILAETISAISTIITPTIFTNSNKLILSNIINANSLFNIPNIHVTFSKIINIPFAYSSSNIINPIAGSTNLYTLTLEVVENYVSLTWTKAGGG